MQQPAVLRGQSDHSPLAGPRGSATPVTVSSIQRQQRIAACALPPETALLARVEGLGERSAVPLAAAGSIKDRIELEHGRGGLVRQPRGERAERARRIARKALRGPVEQRGSRSL